MLKSAEQHGRQEGDMKNRLKAQLLKNCNDTSLNSYKAYRNVLNRAIEFAKQNYYQTALSTNQKSPKKLWKTINELSTTNKTELVIPDKLHIGVNNDTATHPQNIAEEFNRYFVNVGKKMSDLILPADPNVEHNTKKPFKLSNSLFLNPTTSNEVATLIDQLSNQKTKRPLGIETTFIKLSKYVISTPLSEFFNLCVTQGTFSTYLKIAEVIPVFKKGDKHMASNYRPIHFIAIRQNH